MNRKILFTNNLRFLKKCLGNAKKDITFFVIEENNESNLIRRYLSLQHNSCEITNRKIIEEKDFIKKYNSLIYQINIKNASRSWWAMNFTNKNPLLTNLCKDTYDSLTIIRLIEQTPCENLVIVSSNKALGRYIKYWSDKKEIYVHSFISTKPNVKYLLSRIPALFIFCAFLKALVRRILSSLFLGTINSFLRNDYIIITQFENNSFKEDGSFYDVYFGQLREFLKKENKSFMTCGYVGCAFKNIIKKAGKDIQQESVFPLEYFISFGSLFRCLGESIFSYFKRHAKLESDTKIDGVNVFRIIKNEIDTAYNTGQTFVNLSVFYSVKDLLKLVWTQKISYPFENRSWEKMVLLAAREIPRNIKLIGYQHASLTPKHINFILEKEEADAFPFPDEIITMGYFTRNMMIDLFNFPKDKVKVGCALRRTLPQIDIPRSKSPEKIDRILIALASSIDEYVGVLRFLDLAFSKSQPYRLAIRPHPAIDFKRALTIYRPQNIKYELDNFALFDSLKISDIVGYASSTVSMEAISLGIPVIYIDLNGFLCPDPMFNASYLKWSCKDPKQLSRLIENISKIDKASFLNMQKEARKFADSYFVTTTESAMRVFI